MIDKEKILNLFRPNIVAQGDIFENAKYLMVYRMMLFLSLALFFLFLVLVLFFNLYYGISTFVGLLASCAALFYIRKTGEYKKFILGFNILGAILCVLTLFIIQDTAHLVDGLWMVISCLFTFLTVGQRWALIITVFHVLGLSVFYGLYLNEQLVLIKDLTQVQIISTIFNVAICFFIIFYLNWQNHRMTRDAQQQLNAANDSMKAQFDVIYKQNEEKSVLLKEIHHRVKNNLQVIISLLRLQSRDLTDTKEVSKFAESINRIVTMSLIHEKVYQNEELSNVNLKDYFTTLAQDFLRSYDKKQAIHFEMTTEIETLDLKPIVPLALIFNELFTNSLKYAFEEMEEGRIELRFTPAENDCYVFSYSDNGKWKQPLATGQAGEKENTFGLELIDALTEQLNGTMERTFDSGTKYRFYFDKLNA